MAIELPENPTEPEDPAADVVVIGAGMAGLGAAAALQSDGVRVQVLEGRNRIGGRIHTSRLWKEPVDLGASWIHGARGNPLTELARDFDIPTAVTNFRKIVTYDVDGAPLSVNGRAFQDEIEARLESLATTQEELWASEAPATEADDPIPAGSVYEALCEGLDPELLDEAHRRWWWAVASGWEHAYGADLERLDRRTGLLSPGFSGPDRVFPGGYGRLVDHLADGLDVRLGCEVVRLIVGSGAVDIFLASGERVRAGRVIVTVPLGVLQRKSITFEPALPAAKQEAIDRLGFGLLDKCALRFGHCFWDEDAHFITHVDSQRGRWSEFFNLVPSTGAPILVGFSGGAFAEDLAPWPDGAVVGSAMDVLRGIYGDSIPEPESWQITSWGQDPWSFGSYSYYAVGSEPKHRRDLAEPVGDRLFFAGEATIEEGYQTVHGALLSGLREADRILDLSRDLKP